MTKSAAMVVIESGSTVSLKNRNGPAASIFEASSNSSGMVMKNWRNSSVPVAEAISGTVRTMCGSIRDRRVWRSIMPRLAWPSIRHPALDVAELHRREGDDEDHQDDGLRGRAPEVAAGLAVAEDLEHEGLRGPGRPAMGHG